MKKMYYLAGATVLSMALAACAPEGDRNRNTPPTPQSEAMDNDRGVVHDIATSTAETTGKAVAATEEAWDKTAAKTDNAMDRAAVKTDQTTQEAKSDYQDMKQDVKEAYHDGKQEQKNKP